jgi:Icc-related predicted phosphoesterase
MLHSAITVPDGDVLVHTGDATKLGKEAQIVEVNRWLGTLPHKHKILISGNHDFGFERDPAMRDRMTNAIYLQDSGVTIDGIEFYGSPWQPRFYNWAFNLDRGTPLKAIWDKVPETTQVLLTHGPPFGILDMTERGEPVGCEELRKLVFRLPRLKLHVFGHIHEAYGETFQGGTYFVNASICDLRYRPVNPPIVVDI